MEIKTVPLSAVYADEMNPRDDFGDIDALAESFSAGLWPGEPVQPIVVVADGARWRIVDGERRWRAMRSLARETCHAVCCEGLDEANSVLAMLATNDKKELSEMERSRGVQQALLLGVEPEKVEHAGRFTGAAGVARAMKRVGDAAKAAQMPLAQLAAIDAAEQAGDLDGAAEIAEAGAGWRGAANKAQARRETEEERAAWREKCKEAGANLAESRDDIPDGYTFARRLSLDDGLDSLPADAVVSLGGANNTWLYLPDDGEDEKKSEEERALEERKELFAAQGAALVRALWKWAVGIAFPFALEVEPAESMRAQRAVAELWLEQKDAVQTVAGHVSALSEEMAEDMRKRGRMSHPNVDGWVLLALFDSLVGGLPYYVTAKLAAGNKLDKWDLNRLSQLVTVADAAGIADADAQERGFGELLEAARAACGETVEG